MSSWSAADLAAFVEMNNEAVPAVSPLDVAAAERLVQIAEHVVRRADGIVVLLGPGAEYASDNYRWFSDRYRKFLYVDRIIVGPDARGRGVGDEMYREVFGLADAAGVVVLAEVNLDPPNPGSSRFHRRCGFEPVGTLRHSDEYVVEMLCRLTENAKEGRP